MTAKKFFYVMIGVIIALVGSIIMAIFVSNSFLKNQEKKLVAVKVENRVIEEQQKFLLQAKADLAKYSELETITKSIVPQDKDQAKTVRELTAIARRSGIELRSISFAASELGSTVAIPGSTPGAKSPLSQVKPVEGIPGVFALEITISPDEAQPISYYQFLGFLENLESNRRTAHVDKITLNPSPSGNTLSFILTLNAYVKP